VNISTRFYSWLLFAYPAEFRLEFGQEMLQVFRDSYRAEARNGSLPSFWLRILSDLVLTVVKERADSARRKSMFMNRRSDAVALLACVGIIAIAFLLHRYIVNNNVPIILFFGYILDALIVTGVIGNFIVFLLNKTTKLNPLRTASSVFAMVHAILLLLIVVISRNGPPVNWAGVMVGYVVSFVIWVGLHFAWHSTKRNHALSSQ
jgi:hypothetical protein